LPSKPTELFSNGLTQINLTNLKYGIRFFLTTVLLLGMQVAKAQFKIEGLAKHELIEFKFIKNLIIIPLTINNKGPYNFILDTGVGVFLISDPKLIDTLHLTNLRKIKVIGFGEGKELEAGVTGYLDVNIGRSIAGSLPAAVLKEDAFDLSSYTGIPIHGLIGYEFFNSFIVRINFLEKALRVYKPSLDVNLRKGTTIPIIINGGKPYLICKIALGDSIINAQMIVDTGAGHPLWIENVDQRPVVLPGKNIPANLGVGLTGAIDGHIARISSLRIDKFELKNVIAAFPDFNDVGSKVGSERNGNMGNAILKRFEVIFDYRRNALQLKPNYDFKKAFEHDMSGLELVYRTPDFTRLFIGRVEPGSPADELGLIPDDEIININFKPAKDWNIDEVQELFRSRPEKGILLTVLPKGEKKTQLLMLTLKRRI